MTGPTDELTYKAIVENLREVLPNSLVVPNLGTNTAVLMHEGERDLDFYMWGAMGLTHSIGLGLAMARPDRTVVVLDGDGSLLMGLAGMATIGAVRSTNLVHVALDNHAWGNTGGQPTHTADAVDLAAVAAGCGYPVSTKVGSPDELREALTAHREDPQLTFVHVPIPIVPIERPPGEPSPVLIKTRFMNSCNGAAE